ncbi:MAG: multidrug ABC transporter ATP-binding protein, partial [Clostridia bacterium]|nr:multidrug ABC transporter ATP-binding protein [Clostridia bacterium]
ILDEATSSLDTKTEKEIQKSLEELAVGRTTLIIAHRLSTIQNADRILIITNDGIAEQGTHADLMKKEGIYASLYNGLV